MIDEQRKTTLYRMLEKLATIDRSLRGVPISALTKPEYEAFVKEWFSEDVASHLLSLHERASTTHDSKYEPLFSVFSEIELEGRTGKKAWIHPDVIHDIEYTDAPESEKMKESMTKLFKAFKENVKAYRWNGMKRFYHDFHALFKRYTANLSAFVLPESHVPFYENHKLETVFQDTHDIYLVDYDLSGVQSFIYRVTEGGDAKKAVARSVRGRSFYLSLLSDFVGYAMLDAFHLSYEHLLVSAGGKGTVAIPEQDGLKEKLVALFKDVEKMLFSRHGTDLTVSFTTKRVSKDDLVNTYQEALAEIDQGLSTSKKQKSKYVLSDIDQNTIDYGDHRCAMCGAMVKDGQPRCPVCRDALRLSDALSDPRGITLSYQYTDGDDPRGGDGTRIVFEGLGHIDVLFKGDAIGHDADGYFVSLNHDDIGEIKHYANVFARGETFQTIANASEGDSKLAMIKMDVDNLGMIFLRGLKKTNQAFLKYLTLSRTMDYFFTSRLARICSRERYERKIYVSYAGGDDLVIVSPASMCLDLIDDIRQEFSRFTNDHPMIHASSGIEVFHPKSPFRQAVKFADGHLDQSKSRPEKDSFTFLGITRPNRELTRINRDVAYYKDLYQRDILSKSTIQKIYQALDDSVHDPEVRKTFYRYVPLISYMLERNMKPGDQKEKKELMTRFVTTDIDSEMLMMSYVVFGMVLLSTRHAKNEEVDA